jgi:hypothetical protein
MKGLAMLRRTAWVGGLLLTSTLAGSSFAVAASVIEGINDPQRIPGQYIVILKEDVQLRSVLSPEQRIMHVTERAQRLSERMRGRVLHRYSGQVQGFAVRASEARIKALVNDPEVAWIEVDRMVNLNATQSNAPWGLDRIDARAGLDRQYTYGATGAGVNAYIIDTGLRSSHSEFTGRVGQGFTSINDGRGTEDCNGHGTHVTGSIGGRTYGVAKDVKVYPVRVFGCQSSTPNSAILAGVDWVAQNADLPAVVNMSLGGGQSTALNNAVQKMVDAGVVVVVAAGNSNADACSSSPASLATAITVGATTTSDARASYSNFGRCVDIFAPGSNILSAWFNGDNATQSISGTSMASPHVAGAVALLLEESPDATPDAITRTLLAQATRNALSNPGNSSPNLLLFTGESSPTPDPGPGPTPEPDPDPTPADPCGPNCQVFRGNLAPGGQAILPPGGSFRGSGILKGHLRGPAGADFDLFLQRRGTFGWSRVAEGTSDSSDEDITFQASTGNYRWVVVSTTGSGSFTFYTP